MKLRPRSRVRPRPRSGAGLCRALSKLGMCSRTEAVAFITAGRVTVNGATCLDPAREVDAQRDRITVDGQPARPPARAYFMLNKPRGLVTSARDEKGRGTIFDCLRRAEGPLPRHIAAVGRLDMASEGLLLLTNDTHWAARITDPRSRVPKTYHVQVDCIAGEKLLARITSGVLAEGGQLAASQASLLRHGQRNSWIEIVLDEGRNRHIRRMLAALDVGVLRLVRVSIGPVMLGDLAKGQMRELTQDEVRSLGGPPPWRDGG